MPRDDHPADLEDRERAGQRGATAPVPGPAETSSAAPGGPGRAAAVSGLAGRRLLVLALALGTIGLLTLLLTLALAADGLGWREAVLAGLFALSLPWLSVGFWNSVIGSLILLAGRADSHRLLPLIRPPAGRRLASRTAIALPIHEEDPEQVFRHLRAVIASLAATGEGAAFEIFVLSDTADAVLARREAKAFRRLQRERAGTAPLLHYRRRAGNAGFKAGNLRRFCEAEGRRFDFMIVLDADSVMTGAAMRRLAGLMEANPDLGILQTLVVGLPSASPFARLFQFGMRHGMRAHTVGSAWWQGDGGPYWGHNAIVRLAPFIAACRLPRLAGAPPLGGAILSHDQVEAVLMRRAGYAVRVLPLEDGSWEANPPTLPDFVRRDSRWGLGNLQYLRLRLPGLHPLGRLQLAMAVLMYTGSPVWLAALLWATVILLAGPGAPLFSLPEGAAAIAVAPATALGLALIGSVIGLALAPKLLGLAFAFADPGERRAFGGGVRLAAGAVLELLFSMLLMPVMAFAQARLIVGLALRRLPPAWRRQRRAGRAVGWREAARAHAPEGVLGLAWLLTLAWAAPAMLPWAAPVLAGWLLAVPFAVVTAAPALGHRLVWAGLAASPEELRPPPEVAAVTPWLPRRPGTPAAPAVAPARGTG